MLLLLELHLSGSANLDDRNATGQLGEALLELLTVVVGVGVVDLSLQLADAALDVVLVTSTFDDGRLVLGHDDLAGGAEEFEPSVLELQADFFGDDGSTGQNRDVLEHGLAALTEARCLDGNGAEGAADLVDDQGGEGFAFQVLSDDHEGLASLHDLLEHRHEVTHCGDLPADEEDVGVLEGGLHALGVGGEVGGDVALVEAHSFNEVHVHAEGVGLLNGDDTVLAHLVDGVGDQGANLAVGSRDGGNLGDLLFGVGGHGQVVQRLGRCNNGCLDALLERHRVGASSHVLQALTHERPSEHGGRRGAVTSNVVGLLGNFFDELCADLLEGVFEVDLLGDGDTVVGDRRGAPLLVEHYVAALWPKGDAHCVSQLVHSSLETPTGLFIECNELRHRSLSSVGVVSTRGLPRCCHAVYQPLALEQAEC